MNFGDFVSKKKVLLVGEFAKNREPEAPFMDYFWYRIFHSLFRLEFHITHKMISDETLEQRKQVRFHVYFTKNKRLFPELALFTEKGRRHNIFVWLWEIAQHQMKLEEIVLAHGQIQQRNN